MIEFAVVAPLAFLLLLGGIDFGRLTFDNNFTYNAAREGTRAAIPQTQANATSAKIQAAVHDAVARGLGGGTRLEPTVGDLSLLPVSGTGPRTCPTPRPSPNDAVIYMTPYPTIPVGQSPVTVQVCYYFSPFTPVVARLFPSTFVFAATATMTTEY